MTILSMDRPRTVSNNVVRHAKSEDRTVRWLALAAAVVSAIAFGWFYHRGAVLSYEDAVSHMEISRRVVDSPTTGFGQLGGVWLPLPHLLMLPFIWFNPFYYSGFAGSIVSMAAYVVTSVLLYKTLHSLTGNKLAGLVGALVFMLNPNVLYMQSTPMTELLLFACLTGMVYGVQRWIQTGSYQYIGGAIAACIAGELSRYEAWPLFGVLFVIVVVVAWRRRTKAAQAEDYTLTFLFVGGLGVLGWLAWCGLMFGNMLYFQDGEYAKPSLWVGSGEQAVGHIGVAARTYWYAMTDNISLAVAALMILGGLVLVAKRRLAFETLPVLSLLVFFPFFVMALYEGQRPLHVTQVTSDLYNVRFGLLMVLPAALLIGYLSGVFLTVGKKQVSAVAVTSIVLVCGLLFTSNPVTLVEASAFSSGTSVQVSDDASAYLRANYDGGLVLMESFSNEIVLQHAHVDPGHNLYEGSYKLWDLALRDPQAAHVRWIVMRRAKSTYGSDVVYDRLYGSSALKAYDLVYSNSSYYVYRVR